MRVVVLGGAGNFGARIIRALQGDPVMALVSAGRRATPVAGAKSVPSKVIDIDAPDLAMQLRALAPGLVIHCVGPFQKQGYRVAEAALAAGAHYLDLADGRDFVTRFADAVAPAAAKADRVAISGASTLPALSSAVVEHLRAPLQRLDSIEIAIAPGQRAPRGVATLAAVFSYVGRPLQIWQAGKWRTTWGWMDLRRTTFDFGARWGAVCDVPDLALWPQRFPQLQDVSFHAALEFRMQQLVLWKLAVLRRIGLPLPVERWAAPLNRWAGVFDRFGGEWGGMRVSVVGATAEGRRLRRTWQLTAPVLNGPEIPCMAAILLARRIAGGVVPSSGAFPCVGFLTIGQFQPEFERFGITTRIEEGDA